MDCIGCRQKLSGKIQKVTQHGNPVESTARKHGFLSILTTPPSDPADASVIVNVPPDWVKLPYGRETAAM